MFIGLWLAKKLGLVAGILGFFGGFGIAALSIVGLVWLLAFWSKRRRKEIQDRSFK
jgi:hypothetical protein